MTIYLDNAATSYPKAPGVTEAMLAAMNEAYGSAGRATHRASIAAQRLVDRTRLLAAQFLRAPDARQIIFTSNGTEALNLAIFGLLQSGDHVIATTLEHNSVRRPLLAAADSGVQITWVAPDPDGRINPSTMRHLVQRDTRLIALTHASNVTGQVQPVEAVAEWARELGVRLLVDASQTAGHLPLSLPSLGADLVACPGHKGLLGPLGTGLLWMASGVDAELRPTRLGGSGSDSRSPHAPAEMPDRFEAGNTNVPAIAGLGAALEWHLQQSTETLQQHAFKLGRQLVEGLSHLPGVRIPALDAWTDDGASSQLVPLLSFAIDGWDSNDVAAVLDAQFDIAVRAGLHCAPLIHDHLATESTGGLVRLSWGPFTTEADIASAVSAIQQLVGSA